MGADAWRPCPRCLKNRALDLNEDQRQLADAYGKVSAAKYLEMSQATIAKTICDLDDTFREDYHISTDPSGKFVVNYSGECTVDGCGYEVSFRVEEMHTP